MKTATPTTPAAPPAASRPERHAPQPPAASRDLLIESGKSEATYWADLWRYRELFFVLAWRDIAVRYKQTVVGVGWAIIRPVFTTVVFTIIFGRLAGIPSDGNVPYPLLVFAGMLPWFLFASILGEASNSLVTSANLISKVYFPRLLIPMSVAVVAFVDFAISLVILGGLMAWYGFVPNWNIVWLPLFIMLAVAASIGPALFVSALNVRYRDFRYVIPFIVQLGLYASPVGFSSAVVPEEWRFWYSLNPMVGVIDGFRWCLLGGQSQLYLPGFLAGVCGVVVLFFLGLRYFQRTERTIADLV